MGVPFNSHTLALLPLLLLLLMCACAYNIHTHQDPNFSLTNGSVSSYSLKLKELW